MAMPLEQAYAAAKARRAMATNDALQITEDKVMATPVATRPNATAICSYQVLC